MILTARSCPRVVLLLLLFATLTTMSGCASINNLFGGDTPEPQEAATTAEPDPAPASEVTPAEQDIAPTPPPPVTKDVTKDMPKAPKAPKLEKAGPVPDAKGDVLYANVNELLEAAKQAEKQNRFVGDIEPFDAFPDLPGNDTVGRVFKADAEKKITIKFFAFHVPGKSFHRQVYGYLVDAGGGKVFGHFDSDADGKFDAHTLEPSLRFDLYEKRKP